MAAFMGFATWYDCYFLSNVSRTINESVMKTKTKRTQRSGKFSTHRGVYEYSTQSFLDELEQEEDWKKLYKEKDSRKN